MVRRFHSTVPGTPDQLPIVPDYHGLATTNSIKNFILHNNAGKVCLIAGKQSKHSSVIVASGPDISPLLAFACTLVAWVSLNVPSKAGYGL
jgi:hypothetical protein